LRFVYDQNRYVETKSRVASPHRVRACLVLAPIARGDACSTA
jgi:hypothetical protein